MISDLLSTCYSDSISISRPQTLENSFEEEERESSPIHLSSAASTSSRVTCFSQRLVELDKNSNEKTSQFALGRGRGIEISSLQIDRSPIKRKNNIQENSIDNHPRASPTFSINQTSEFHLHIH